MNKTAASLIYLLGLLIFGGLGVIMVGATIYIFLTDGVDNLRGVPETGWAAGLALFIYLPIGTTLLLLANLCRQKYILASQDKTAR